MSLAFALGLVIGAGVIIFGRETPVGRRLMIELHLRLALLQRWLRSRR